MRMCLGRRGGKEGKGGVTRHLLFRVHGSEADPALKLKNVLFLSV